MFIKNNNLKFLEDSTFSPVKITTTLYMLGNFVNDTLQFLPQEEGRIRFRTDSSKLVYDYFLKDHLGNVRKGKILEYQNISAQLDKLYHTKQYSELYEKDVKRN